MERFWSVVAICAWLVVAGCTSSLNERINEKKRACGAFVHDAIPILGADGRTLDESDRSQLQVSLLNGSSQADLLTSKSCLDRPADAPDILITYLREKSYAVVSQAPSSIQLISWKQPEFRWDCPHTLRLRRDSQIPLDVNGQFNLKAQELSIEIQGTAGQAPQMELMSPRALGLQGPLILKPRLENGEYTARPWLLNPFGEQISLAPPCSLSVRTEKPRLDFVTPARGDLVLDADDPLPYSTDTDVQLRYCLAPAEQSNSCISDAEFLDIAAWQLPENGQHFLLFLRGIDAYGNENRRDRLPLAIDRRAPDIQLKWTQSEKNGLGRFDRLPFRGYGVQIVASDDLSPSQHVMEGLECRVVLQIDATTEVSGSFARCTSGRCEGMDLSSWRPCSENFSFQLDSSYWKTYRKPRELMVQARTSDERGKLAFASRMTMIDSQLYPHLQADIWQGRPLDKIRDMARVKEHSYVVIRQLTDDWFGPTEILLGDFGNWTRMPQPENRNPIVVKADAGRIFAVFRLQNTHDDQLKEWMPESQTWRDMNFFPADALDVRSWLPATDQRGTYWLLGQSPEKAFRMLTEDGSVQTYSCPSQNLTRADIPILGGGIIENDFVVNVTGIGLWKLNRKTGDCAWESYPEFEAIVPHFRNYEVYIDQDQRIWRGTRQSLSYYKDGQWNAVPIAPMPKFPSDSPFEGGFLFPEGTVAILQNDDVSFIPVPGRPESFEFNAYNSTIDGGLPPSPTGEAYQSIHSRPYFFADADAILSIKGGVLTRMADRPNSFFTPSQFKGPGRQLVVQDAAIYLAMDLRGLSILSPERLQRYTETFGLPFNGVSGLLFDGPQLTSIFGYDTQRDWMTARKADLIGTQFKEDADFAKLRLQTYEGPMAPARDTSGQLWLGTTQFGEYYPWGVHSIHDKTAELMKDPDGKPMQSKVISMVAAADGSVFWKSLMPNFNADAIWFNLFAWSPKNGTVLVSQSKNLFTKIYELTSIQGEPWISGINSKNQAILAVYRNGEWVEQAGPGNRDIHCLRFGANRKHELFCLGLRSGVHVFDGKAWTSYTTAPWTEGAKDKRYPYLNNVNRMAYYEDGLLWIARDVLETIEMYEVRPSAGTGRWWLPGPNE